MDSFVQLEARLHSLETSVRRSRLLAFMLGLTVVLIAGAAQVPGARDEMTTNRLLLFDGSDSIALIAGPESSLILETPSGVEVLQLGGPPLRRIKR